MGQMPAALSGGATLAPGGRMQGTRRQFLVLPQREAYVKRPGETAAGLKRLQSADWSQIWGIIAAPHHPSQGFNGKEGAW